MSIRTTDMQVLIQKTTDVAKLQNIHQQELAAKQHEFNNLNIEQTMKNTHSVNKTLRDESALVHEKQEREKNSKQNQNKEGNGKSEENKKEEQKLFEPGRGINVDIVV